MNHINPEKPTFQPQSTEVQHVLKEISEVRITYNNRDIWMRTKASAFIEGILLRAPIKPIYGFINKVGETVILEGSEIISTLVRFTKNEFELNNLHYFHEYEGKYYEELPVHIQRRILQHPIQIIFFSPGISLEDAETFVGIIPR